MAGSAPCAERDATRGGSLSESLNTDVAHELHERHRSSGEGGWERLSEIVEVVFLAVVATITAWSGYQAAKWDGREAALYEDATQDRFRAEAASTLGGLELVADSALFTAWLQAVHADDRALQRELEARFTADFRGDFDRWVANGARADIGFRPDYERNANVRVAARLNRRSKEAFVEGRRADAVADRYVRNTVLLATVLFLIAIAQRLTGRWMRIAVNVGAFAMLVYVVGTTVSLPRIG